MGDRIEFPLNNDYYFNQAIHYLIAEELEKSIEAFEKVYASDKSFTTNRLYASTLYAAEYFEEALEIANDKKNDYINSEEFGAFYTLLLIQNHLFIEAEALIQRHLKNSMSPFFMEWKVTSEELEKERTRVELEVQRKLKETKDHLSRLETLSTIEQIQTIHNAQLLNVEDLQENAQKILIHSQISTTARQSFLELLIQKNDSTLYTYQWVNGLRKLVPKELNTFESSKVMTHLLTILEKKLEKNPSFIESIQTEIMNDLLILYPFEDEVVSDINYWVEGYLETFGLLSRSAKEKEPLTVNEKEMNQWQDYLNQMAQRISH